MRICVGQINTTPGDFDGNRDRILTGARLASDQNCDLVIFPELSVPGYLSQDLIYNPDFVARNHDIVSEIVSASAELSPALHIILGYIGQNESSGKPFTNMAGVIRAGELVQTYQKQLLPFYDVFDEGRYFEPGSGTTIFEVGGNKVGIAICEDLWNDKASDDYNYDDNPLQRYRESKVDVVVSLNSSPYVQGKCSERIRHIVPAATDELSIVYVNQCGAQDELVFDGQSFVAQHGEVIYLNQVVSEDSFDVVDLADSATSRSRSIATVIAQGTVSLREMLVLGLRDYAQKSGFTDVVLASSGGVDSALVCSIACEAVGSSHVHAIRMPSQYSSEHSKIDAQRLHENLGCWDYEMPIEHEQLVDKLNARFSENGDEANLVSRRLQENEYQSVADENIQARLRDVYVMHFSNAFGAMPLSTGNKTESACGYYTHFDMNFSFAPIKDLYKFEVTGLARSDESIPENIWEKPPSAELAHGQTDEASLMPYALLDAIVMAYVEEYVTNFPRFREWVDVASRERNISSDAERLVRWVREDESVDDYNRIVSLIGRMEYKRRQTCPGTKVSRVAFGIGRRIPIVEKWS